ncbi:MAG: hypothetical protein D6795_03030 [Deltaproteobacteria bacterium]|nr:MAG: hypothetical protein D6795_03030 [Deltaproteobacteria bacterium]
MVKTAFLHLLAGFLVGFLVLMGKIGWLSPLWWTRLPIHVDFVLLGWTMQLPMGVAFWLLPRFGAGATRGRESFAWGAYLLLNLGVVLHVGGVAFGLPTIGVLGRIATFLSALSFAVHAWPRVRQIENLPRDRKKIDEMLAARGIR